MNYYGKEQLEAAAWLRLSRGRAVPQGDVDERDIKEVAKSPQDLEGLPPVPLLRRDRRLASRPHARRCPGRLPASGPGRRVPVVQRHVGKRKGFSPKGESSGKQTPLPPHLCKKASTRVWRTGQGDQAWVASTWSRETWVRPATEVGSAVFPAGHVAELRTEEIGFARGEPY